MGVTNVVGTVVAASLMDRAGRKQLLTLSFTGMGLSMLVMAAGLGLESLAGYAGPIALVRSIAGVRAASKTAWLLDLRACAGLRHLWALSGTGLGFGMLLVAAKSGPQQLGAPDAVSLALARHWTGAFVGVSAVAPSVAAFRSAALRFFTTRVSCNAVWSPDFFITWVPCVGTHLCVHAGHPAAMVVAAVSSHVRRCGACRWARWRTL